MGFCAVEQFQDGLGIRCLQESVSDGWILEQSAHPGQDLQIFSGYARRGEDHHKEVDRSVIHRVEADP